MTKRIRKSTIQVFIVSWFPVGAETASTLTAISRDQAKAITETLEKDFSPYPNHNPCIHVDREERKVDF